MRGPAHRPPRPSLPLQAPEPGRRLLARRRAAADAAARLRHGLLDEGGPRARTWPGSRRSRSATTASSAPSSTSSARTPRPAAGFIFWHPNLGAGAARDRDVLVGGAHPPRLRAGLHAARRAREALRGLGAPRELRRHDVRADGRSTSMPYRVKPMNCPGHILIYKTRGRSLPRPAAALGRARHRVPLRALGRAARHAARARLHPGRRAHLLHARAARRRDRRRARARRTRPAAPSASSTRAYLATRPKEKSIGDAASVGARRPRRCAGGASMAGLPLELDEGGGAFYGPEDRLQDQGRARARVAERRPCSATSTCPSASTSSSPTATASRSARSWCTARSSAASSASSACLIEHFGGKFPFWLAPTQVALIPIREEHADYCAALAARLRAELFRVRPATTTPAT